MMAVSFLVVSSLITNGKRLQQSKAWLYRNQLKIWNRVTWETIDEKRRCNQNTLVPGEFGKTFDPDIGHTQ